MTNKYNELAWIIFIFLVVAIGLYGFVVDIFHGHIAWAIFDVVTSGFVAVIRGVGYLFGFIGY